MAATKWQDTKWQDMLLLLERDALVNLLAEFEELEKKEGRGLTKEEFVDACLRNIDEESYPHDRVTTAGLLSEVYDQIDVNGDGQMEWDEFTEFCIEMGATVADEENSVLRRSNYVFDEAFQDRGTASVCNEISCMAYDKEGQILYVSEGNTPFISVYDNHLKKLKTLSIEEGIPSIKEGNAAFVHCVQLVLIPKYSMLLTVLSDHSLCFWYNMAYLVYAGRLTRAGWLPHCACWSASLGKVIIGSRDGKIIVADPIRRRTDHCLTYHDDTVLDIVAVEEFEAVVTSGMDRKLILWDIHSWHMKTTFQGHSSIIVPLVWAPQMSVIFGAGKDEIVFAWSPTSSNPIMRIMGPRCNVTKLEIIHSKPLERLVCVDEKQTYHVWAFADISSASAKCIATISMEGLTANCVSITYPQFDIIVGSTRIFRIRNVIDDTPEAITCILHNLTMRTFITFSKDEIRIWDEAEGKRVQTFANLFTDDEISVACLDDRNRKVITGTQKGKIAVFNCLNGALMKEGKSHNSYVSGLLYVSEARCVISTSWDRTLRVYYEEPQDELLLIREVRNAHKRDITCLEYSERLRLIFTGSADCSIKCWEFDTLKLEKEFIAHSSQITSLATCSSLPLLVSSDARGIVCVWKIGSYAAQFELAYSFQHHKRKKFMYDPAHPFSLYKPDALSIPKREDTDPLDDIDTILRIYSNLDARKASLQSISTPRSIDKEKRNSSVFDANQFLEELNEMELELPLVPTHKSEPAMNSLDLTFITGIDSVGQDSGRAQLNTGRTSCLTQGLTGRQDANIESATNPYIAQPELKGFLLTRLCDEILRRHTKKRKEEVEGTSEEHTGVPDNIELSVSHRLNEVGLGLSYDPKLLEVTKSELAALKGRLKMAEYNMEVSITDVSLEKQVNSHLILYIADDTGTVRVEDISNLVQRMGITPISTDAHTFPPSLKEAFYDGPQIKKTTTKRFSQDHKVEFDTRMLRRSTVKNHRLSNTYTSIDFAKIMPSSNLRRRSIDFIRGIQSVSVREGDRRKISAFVTHQDCISFMKVSMVSKMVMTAGLDGRSFLWSRNGEVLGQLDSPPKEERELKQGLISSINWTVPRRIHHDEEKARNTLAGVDRLRRGKMESRLSVRQKEHDKRASTITLANATEEVSKPYTFEWLEPDIAQSGVDYSKMIYESVNYKKRTDTIDEAVSSDSAGTINPSDSTILKVVDDAEDEVQRDNDSLSDGSKSKTKPILKRTAVSLSGSYVMPKYGNFHTEMTKGKSKHGISTAYSSRYLDTTMSKFLQEKLGNSKVAGRRSRHWKRPVTAVTWGSFDSDDHIGKKELQGPFVKVDCQRSSTEGLPELKVRIPSKDSQNESKSNEIHSEELRDKVSTYYKSAWRGSPNTSRIRTKYGPRSQSADAKFPVHLYSPAERRAYVEHPSSKYYEKLANEGRNAEVMPSHFGPYSALEVVRVRRLFEAAVPTGETTVELHNLLHSPEWRLLYPPEKIEIMFDAMDSSKNGNISLVEVFKVVFPGANHAQIQSMMKHTSLSKTNQAMPVSKKTRRASVEQSNYIEDIFNAFDKNGDGKVNLQEMQEACQSGQQQSFGLKDLKKIIVQYSDDKAEDLTLPQFRKVMEDAFLTRKTNDSVLASTK